MNAIYLSLAIITEVIATLALRKTDGFTQWIPSLLVVVGYGSSFYFMSLVLKVYPVAITYAIWSGVGLVLITLSAIFLYNQKPDAAAVLGMSLILGGVLVIQLFSKMVHLH